MTQVEDTTPRAAAQSEEGAAKTGPEGSEKDVESVKTTEDQTALQVFAPGDYFVHRFSGSYRQVPLWLKEKVVERDGELSTVEYTVDENGSTSVIKVHKIGDDVFSVVRVDGEAETDIGIDAFETLMETTTFAADSNDEALGAEELTMIIGGREVAAKKSRFLVTVDGQEAVLSVVTSDEFPGRDIAGELTLRDGTVVYRAVLVEAGNESPKSNVASRD